MTNDQTIALLEGLKKEVDQWINLRIKELRSDGSGAKTANTVVETVALKIIEAKEKGGV